MVKLGPLPQYGFVRSFDIRAGCHDRFLHIQACPKLARQGKAQRGKKETEAAEEEGQVTMLAHLRGPAFLPVPHISITRRRPCNL